MPLTAVYSLIGMNSVTMVRNDIWMGMLAQADNKISEVGTVKLNIYSGRAYVDSFGNSRI